MATPWTESIVDVLIIWAVCMTIMMGVVYRGLSRFRWRSLRRFARDESGASYTLPYVLTLPITMLMFSLIIQTTLILLVKIGTIQAAFAAARAIIVWQSSDPLDTRAAAQNARFYGDRAAVLAMTPFASGYREHQTRIFPQLAERALTTNRVPKAGLSVWALDRLFGLYRGTYGRLTGEATEPLGHSGIVKQPNALARDRYVQNKLLFAALATDVEFPQQVTPWNEEIEVTVKYLMPMHIPGAARALATNRGGSFFWPQYFAREVTTTVVLPSEAPQTENGLLGIPYYPAQLSRYSFDNLSLDGIW